MSETYHTIDNAVARAGAPPPDEPICLGTLGLVILIFFVFAVSFHVGIKTGGASLKND